VLWLLLALQLPWATINRLRRRWGLCQAVAPPQADQDYFLDVPYKLLLYVAGGGSQVEVVEQLVDMAG
jgi:hypothetical protein